MAGFRKPGPQCLHNDRLDIDDGTMSRSLVHAPGPLVIHPNLITDDPRGDSATYTRALPLAVAAVYRETGYTFDGEALQGLIGLMRPLKKLISADSIPAARTSHKDIVASLGLNFLSETIGCNLAEMIGELPMGILRIDRAGKRGEFDRDLEPEPGAEALASAAGIFVRLILQGIASYIRNGFPIEQDAGAAGRAIRKPKSKITPDAVVAQITGQLRTSEFGKNFATWIEKNWQHLLTNPRLRGAPRRSGGAPAERVVKERKSPVPAALSQPVAEPPTFPHINFGAQAATLVAAAAQGAPFCPL